MNKAQARRIALAIEGSYILHGASADGMTDFLSQADIERVSAAQRELGLELLRRAGFDHPCHYNEIYMKVIGKPLPTPLAE